MWVQSLGQEDTLERGMATDFLAWKIAETEEPGRLQSVESERVRYDLAFTHALWYVNPGILVLDHSSRPLGFPQLFDLEIILSPFPGNFQSRRFCPCGLPWLSVHQGLH